MVDAVESPLIFNGYVITPLCPLPVVVVAPDTVAVPVPPPPTPPPPISLCDDKLYRADMVSVDELERRRCSCRFPLDELFTVDEVDGLVIVDVAVVAVVAVCCSTGSWCGSGVSGDEPEGNVPEEVVEASVETSIWVCSVDTDVEMDEATEGRFSVFLATPPAIILGLLTPSPRSTCCCSSSSSSTGEWSPLISSPFCIFPLLEVFEWYANWSLLSLRWRSVFCALKCVLSSC